MKLRRLRAHVTQSLDYEFRPKFRFIGLAIERALRDRLAAEDSEAKKAVVIDGSRWLAGVLGLKKTRILELQYPDFTIENLALLSDEYDFVIADRFLHRCQSAEDAARETDHQRALLDGSARQAEQGLQSGGAETAPFCRVVSVCRSGRVPGPR